MEEAMWFPNVEPSHVYNEQTKLVATLLNNLATAAITLGFLTPLLTQEVKWAGSLTIGFTGGLSLHLLALQVLRHLSRPETKS
jgi:hypothetical protein